MIYVLTFKDTRDVVPCTYVGDIFIEIDEKYNDESYALDLQVWCENASVGEYYEDENVQIVCELD